MGYSQSCSVAKRLAVAGRNFISELIAKRILLGIHEHLTHRFADFLLYSKPI
jgi:hypothetical protein